MQTARLKVIKAAPFAVERDLLGYDLTPSDKAGKGLSLILENQTGNMDNKTMKLLTGMKIPCILFPGGPIAEFLDWRDFVNNAPGKARFRPLKILDPDGNTIDTRFGVDEFLRVKKNLNCKAVITVNLMDGLARRKSLREAAELAAGLVAYCNADNGSQIPASYAHWPGIRARNGSPIPLMAEYVKLGFQPSSEECMTLIQEAVPHLSGNALARWYIDGLSVYIERIRKADPDIKIMLDGSIGGNLSEQIFANKYIRDNVDYLVLYKPAGQADDHNPSREKFNRILSLAAKTRIDAACMSWSIDQKSGAHNSFLDAAVWINSLMRLGDVIKVASFDSLLGADSGPSALIVNSAPAIPPVLSEIAEIIALYAGCLGGTGFPVLNRDISDPDSLVPGIYITATSSTKALFIHAVNFNKNNYIKVDLDCEGFNMVPGFDMVSLSRSTVNTTKTEQTTHELRKTFSTEKSRKHNVKVKLPPQSVNVLIIPLSAE